MIQVLDISKEYDSCIALNNVSLEITEGEFVAITGKSGSGKSTLLSIISGLDTPSSGKVTIDNVCLNTMSEKEISLFRNTQIGFVFQNYFLEPEYSVFENVELPLLLRKNKKEIKEKCKRVIDLVGLSNKASEKVCHLSGGEQQRCAIARALVIDPKYIFADEPCGNLDSINREKIIEMFHDICMSGKTVIMVTHNLEEAKKASHHIVLQDGSVLSDAII